LSYPKVCCQLCCACAFVSAGQPDGALTEVYRYDPASARAPVAIGFKLLQTATIALAVDFVIVPPCKT
jgi:hypothetical protein